MRDGVLRRITKDHSLVASLVASGKIQPEEVFTHPQRNLIFRSLGQKRSLEVDTYWEALRTGDIMLLCSDGLWEMVQDEKIMAELIKEANTPDQACQMLVDAANTAGGEDNIGVVVAKVT
jgi:protein phosphatase